MHVLHGDGTRGWPEHAPYDAIVVAALGVEVSEALQMQLKIGGRLVIPTGTTPRAQELVRVTRVSSTVFCREELADVRLVPLLGKRGGNLQSESWAPLQFPTGRAEPSLPKMIGKIADPFGSIDDVDLSPLLARIDDARVVLIGEASHGTSEFYRMRAQISRALIEKKQFNFVAIEGDWPDAARIDHYVRHREYRPSEWVAFARFPTWMWRNNEVREFVDWLRNQNASMEQELRVAFHGLHPI